MANIELMKRLRTRLLRIRHRKHFNMKVWGEKNECGTTACIAGHTLLLSGYTLQWNDEHEEFEYVSPKGRRVAPDVAAGRLLGLPKEVTHGDAYDYNGLFFDVNRVKTPKQAAMRIQNLITEYSK